MEYQERETIRRLILALDALEKGDAEQCRLYCQQATDHATSWRDDLERGQG